jgi:outer membrane protein assembly factor BamB
MVHGGHKSIQMISYSGSRWLDAALVMTLCTGPALAQNADWLTFGGSNQRLGYSTTETILSQSSVGGLTLLWTAHIKGVGVLASAENQAVLLHDVQVKRTTEPLVYIGSSEGQVTALNALTGKMAWQVRLPSNAACEGHAYGVDETATIDAANQRMFVVDGNDMLHSLNVSTGTELAPYPVQVVDPANQPPASEVHSSPTMVGNQLYLVTSSPCQDKPPYQGQVISFNLTTASVTARFYPMGASSGLNGGGIWANGGIALSSDGSTLYVGTGNAVEKPQYQGLAESVLKFDLNLNLLDSSTPVTKNGDFDVSATPLLYTSAGCPERLAIVGKSGQLFVYDPTAIGNGPLQTFQVGQSAGSAWLYGVPAFDPNTNAIYFSSYSNSPDGTFQRGLLAFQANTGCQLSPYWNVPLGSTAAARSEIPRPVTIANGVVYLSYVIDDVAQLAAFADDTGKELWNSGTMFSMIDFPGPPMVANGQVFVASKDKFMSFGLPPSPSGAH